MRGGNGNGRRCLTGAQLVHAFTLPYFYLALFCSPFPVREYLLPMDYVPDYPHVPDYPRPTAEPPEIARVQKLYRAQHGLDLSFDEAKDILERVAQFIYLTEIEDALRPLRQEIQ